MPATAALGLRAEEGKTAPLGALLSARPRVCDVAMSRAAAARLVPTGGLLDRAILEGFFEGSGVPR